MYTINCKGKILSLEQPLVMGILNATPDSFYEGHLDEGIRSMADRALQMSHEGAAIIDIGGQSTRPGSARISAEAEMQRILPLIELLKKEDPDIILSVDTYSSEVAQASVKAGASIINDISGGNMDPEMLNIVGSLQVPYICMHMQGDPAHMQDAPVYKDVVLEILNFFIERIAACNQAGIKDIIIDPGFGFGKTIDHNFTILKHLALLQVTGRPVLAGLSRKRTVYQTLGVNAEAALNGTTVVNTMALMNGASLLRVHDVKAAREAVLLYNAYKKAPPGGSAFL